MLKRSGSLTQKQEDWVPYGDAGELLVHGPSFEKGFIVVKPYQDDNNSEINPPVTQHHISIKNRHLKFAVDAHEEPELKREFDSLYPKQAAAVFSRIPALNPYKEWEIYTAPDIESINPQLILNKAIIFVPQKGAANKHISAYFVKRGEFLEKTIERKKTEEITVEITNVVLKGSLNLKTMSPDEITALHENEWPPQQLRKVSSDNLVTDIIKNVKGFPQNIVPSQESKVYVVSNIEDINIQNLPPKAIVLTPQINATNKTAEIRNMTVHIVEDGTLLQRQVEKKVTKKTEINEGNLTVETVNVKLQSDINLQSLTFQEKTLLGIGSKDAWQPATLKKVVLEKKTSLKNEISSDNNNTKLETEDEKSVSQLSNIAKKVLSQESISPFDTFVHNDKRRTEFFVPLDIGLYVSASTSSSLSQSSTAESSEETHEFTDVNNFATVVCMFGPNLKAKDTGENEFILIKHDKEFYGEQKIEDIIYNPRAANPYEYMLFSQLEKQIELIKKISNPNKKTTLSVHLPYVDYMLFGVELFIRGRITTEALGHLFKCILKKREEYIKKINDLCGKNNIMPIIESPFENLFGSLDIPKLTLTKEENYEDLARTILTALEVPVTEVNPSTINEKIQKEKENNLVQSILEKLKSDVNEVTDRNKPKNVLEREANRRQVWQDTLSTLENSQKQIDQETIHGIASRLCTPIVDNDLQQYYIEVLQDLLKTTILLANVQKLEEKVVEYLSNYTSDQIEELVEKLKKDVLDISIGKSKTPADNNSNNPDGEINYWTDSLKFLNKLKMRNLEHLFKRANATQIAIASYKTADTVSLLPLTENRIPLEHSLMQQHRQQMQKNAWDYLLEQLKSFEIYDLTDLFQKNGPNLKETLLASTPAGISQAFVQKHFEALTEKALRLHELKEKLEAEEKFKPAKTNSEEKNRETTTLLTKSLLTLGKTSKGKANRGEDEGKASYRGKIDNSFQPDKDTDYPSILNLTHIDSVLTYSSTLKSKKQTVAVADLTSKSQEENKQSPTTKNKNTGVKKSSDHSGQAFYFAESSAVLVELLKDVKNGLSTIYKNVGFFTRKALVKSSELKPEEKPIPICGYK